MLPINRKVLQSLNGDDAFFIRNESVKRIAETIYNLVIQSAIAGEKRLHYDMNQIYKYFITHNPPDLLLEKLRENLPDCLIEYLQMDGYRTITVDWS